MSNIWWWCFYFRYWSYKYIVFLISVFHWYFWWGGTVESSKMESSVLLLFISFISHEWLKFYRKLSLGNYVKVSKESFWFFPFTIFNSFLQVIRKPTKSHLKIPPQKIYLLCFYTRLILLPWNIMGTTINTKPALPKWWPATGNCSKASCLLVYLIIMVNPAEKVLFKAPFQMKKLRRGLSYCEP